MLEETAQVFLFYFFLNEVMHGGRQVDPLFFFETVAPLLSMESTTLIGISTLLSDVNFYTRLMRLKDKTTGGPLFTVLKIQLACPTCIECGKAAECVHMLHLVPRWQSSGRHEMLRTVMAEIPSLVESELAGLAFDSATTVFKPAHLDIMFSQPVPEIVVNEDVFLFIDPAAGGANSDYALLSITRHKGIVTVSGILLYRVKGGAARETRRCEGGQAGQAVDRVCYHFLKGGEYFFIYVLAM